MIKDSISKKEKKRKEILYSNVLLYVPSSFQHFTNSFISHTFFLLLFSYFFFLSFLLFTSCPTSSFLSSLRVSHFFFSLFSFFTSCAPLLFFLHFVTHFLQCRHTSFPFMPPPLAAPSHYPHHCRSNPNPSSSSTP